MSIRGMQRRFAVRLRYVLYVLIGVFIIGLPFVFTPGLTRRSQHRGEQGGQEVMARVNGEPLHRPEVDKWFAQSLNQLLPIYQSRGSSIHLNQLPELRLQAFQQAVMADLMLRQAKAEGVSVSRGEVRQQAERMAEGELKQISGRYKGEQLEQVLGEVYTRTEGKQRERMSEGAFRKWMIKRLVSTGGDDLRNDLMVEKLRQKVAASVRVTEQDLLASYDRVSFRQLTVSVRPQPVGKSTSGGGEKPARSDEQARKKAEELLAKARQGADFAALVKSESDDEWLREKGGLQTSVAVSSLPPDQQRAIASLKPGELAGPIKGPAGYVIIKLEGRSRELPRDYQEKKEEYLKGLREQRQAQAWQEYSDKLRQEARVETTDPEIRGYQALQQGNTKEALAQLEKAAPEAARLRGLIGGAIYYTLAGLYGERNQWKEAVNNYQAAVDTLSREETSSLADARGDAFMGMGKALEQLGRIEEAVEYYQEASNWSDAAFNHQELVTIFQRLGKLDLAKAERAWLSNYEKEQAERQKAMLEAQQSGVGNRPARLQAPPAASKPVPVSPQPTRPAPKRRTAAPGPVAGKP